MGIQLGIVVGIETGNFNPKDSELYFLKEFPDSFGLAKEEELSLFSYAS